MPNRNPHLVFAGRSALMEEAEALCERAQNGLPVRCLLLLGLRGLGKTTLLEEISRRLLGLGVSAVRIPLSRKAGLAASLFSEMRRVLRALAQVKEAQGAAQKGLRVLRSFAETHRLDASLVSDAKPDPDAANFGDLVFDLPDMVEAVGRAAAKARTAWVLLLDDMDRLEKPDLAALVTALHRAAQEGLPVLLIGAGLPQTARRFFEARPYAERMALCRTLGNLSRDAVEEAVSGAFVQPDEEALDRLMDEPQGHPLFLQLLVNEIKSETLSAEAVERAAPSALEALGREYLGGTRPLDELEIAFIEDAARPDGGSWEMAGTAFRMDARAASRTRSRLMRKGVLWSPKPGTYAFTIPMIRRLVSCRTWLPF